MRADVPPPINGVVETILYVDELPRAVAFYRDVLGLAPMTGDPARFQAFDSGAGRVLLLFKRGGTLAPTPVRGVRSAHAARREAQELLARARRAVEQDEKTALAHLAGWAATDQVRQVATRGLSARRPLLGCGHERDRIA